MIVEVHKCGSEVILKLNSLTGIVTAINIRFGLVSYEITYASGSDIKTEWCYDCEIEFKKDNTQEIGFND